MNELIIKITPKRETIKNLRFIKETLSRVVHFTKQNALEQILSDGFIKPADITKQEMEAFGLTTIPFFKSIGAISVFNFKKEYVQSDLNDFNKHIYLNRMNFCTYTNKLKKEIQNTSNAEKKELLWHKLYLDAAQKFWHKINHYDICIIFNEEIDINLLSWVKKYEHKRHGLVIPCLEMGHIGNIPISRINKIIRMQYL